MKQRIYLAGPDVFLHDCFEVLLHKKTCLEQLGYDVLTPLDKCLTDPKDIAIANEDLIRQCDIIVANVEPFRGTEPDSGTVYEIGFGRALGKKVLTYNNPDTSYKERLEVHDEKYGQSKFIPERFGLPQNLMISCSTSGEFSSFEELLFNLKAFGPQA